MTPTVSTDDLSQHKPLFDALTAYVTGCSGYTLVGTYEHLVCAEFKYPGGKFPLALDPQKPIPHNVNILHKALLLNRFLADLPRLKLPGG